MVFDVGLGAIVDHSCSVLSGLLASIVLSVCRLVPLVSDDSRQRLAFFLLYGWRQPLVWLVGAVYQRWLVDGGGLLPSHIAIIMDGNRRFARELGIASVKAGHEKGAEKLREFVDWCLLYPSVREVTVWALSTDNLTGRSAAEIDDLWDLCEQHLPDWSAPDSTGQRALQQRGVMVRVVGEKHMLPQRIQTIVDDLELRTALDNPRLVLNVALAYGGREEIVAAARHKGVDRIADGMYTLTSPDLIIRTGAETRLSGFMMWQSQHAELYFSAQLWPAFTRTHFLAALFDFQKRKRRFGK